MKTLYICLIAAMAATSAFENSANAIGKRRLTDSTESIRIGDDVPEDQANLIIGDLKFLETFEFKTPGSDLTRILKLESVNGSQLQKWLSSRVQYIVSESFDVQSSISVEKSYYRYENSEALPTIEKSLKNSDSGGDVKTVMTNLGGALYYAGKTSNSLLGAEIKGWDTLAITSPRSGLIKIGEGLFIPMSPNNRDLKSAGNRIARMATFFHEARHSDGNGKSLGFFHAVCPSGHDYEGYSACDRNLNGPYTVGALITQSLLESCTTCTVAEREELKLRQLDSASRVIKVTRTNKDLSILREQKRMCAELSGLSERFGIALPENCKNLPAENSPEALYNDTPSREWDDQPEGSR